MFSVGPIGDPPRPAGDLPAIESLGDELGARGHRMFAGRLDRSELSLPERLVVAGLRAPEGDFRDWDEVRAWAADVSSTLSTNTGAR